MIHQAAAHLRGHQAEERLVCVYCPGAAAEQAHVGVVQQRGGLKRMRMALAAQVAVGDAMQFAVGPGDDLFAGFGVSRLPGVEQLGNLARHGQPTRK